MARLFAVAVISAVLLLAGRAAVSQRAPATQDAAPAATSVEEFASLIGRPDHILLDVRTPEEHAAGHIDGTYQLIDFNATDFSQKLEALPREKTYLIYCRSGRRSGLAATQMREMGFSRVIDLAGGIQAWQNAGKPVAK